jgi:hypothetical protein
MLLKLPSIAVKITGIREDSSETIKMKSHIALELHNYRVNDVYNNDIKKDLPILALTK